MHTHIKLKRGENEGVRVAVGPYEIVLGCLASRQISGPRVIEHQSLNAWYNPKKCLFLIRKFVLELNEILIVSSFLLHPGDCTIVSSRQISTCKWNSTKRLNELDYDRNEATGRLKYVRSGD